MKQLALSGISNINYINNITSSKNITSIGSKLKEMTVYPLTGVKEDWFKKYIVDIVIAEKEKIMNLVYAGIVNLCEIGCVVCIIVCGVSILWFIIDQNGNTPRKYISGSFVFYIGMRLVQYVIG